MKRTSQSTPLRRLLPKSERPSSSGLTGGSSAFNYTGSPIKSGMTARCHFGNRLLRGGDLEEGDRSPPPNLPHPSFAKATAGKQGGGIYIGHIRHRFRSIIAYPATETEGGIIVEVGPGRGDFLFHLAETNPDKRVYGIEIKGKRFDKLIKRRDKRKLHNLRLILADAAYALPRFFEPNEIETIHINFPDPWPKERHAKKRLLKPFFLETCAEALKPGGTLFITTDVSWYADETYETCSKIPKLKSLYDGATTGNEVEEE